VIIPYVDHAIGYTFDPNSGAEAAVFGLGGNADGNGPGEFNNARYHSYGPDGRCYVLDYGNGRVQVLDPNDSYAYVSEIAIDAGVVNMTFAIDPNSGKLYLGDGAGGGFVYEPDGTFVEHFMLPEGSYTNPFTNGINPYLATTQDGYVFVLDNTGAHQYSMPPPPTPTATETETPIPTDTPTQTPTPTPTAAIAGCAATPVGGCTSAPKSSLSIKNDGRPEKSQLVWKWLKGTIGADDLGDPTAETSYALCLYEDGAFAAEIDAEAGASWAATRSGFSYKPSAANADGLSRATLKTGSGKAKLQFKAKGASLAAPAPPLTPSNRVTVQLVKNPGSGTGCWQSTFTAPFKKDASPLFKAIH
jgi:hypothetical protein